MAGAWTPPEPSTPRNRLSQRAPFTQGYTYGDLANLILPDFTDDSTSSATARYSNAQPSSEAPAFVLHDPELETDLFQWFEVMMSAIPNRQPPSPMNGPIIRHRPTPPACFHSWDVILTHAMTPCLNESWVEAYATKIMDLLSCLIQGIWPTARVAEWPVVAEFSQRGDCHIVTAFLQSYQTTQGQQRRALPAHLAFSGEWKTETVLQHHLSDMIEDHDLPAAQAHDGDSILKKLGLHIESTHTQCQERNQTLAAVVPVVSSVNVEYGIVFTGATCVVAQAGEFCLQFLIGPTPVNLATVNGMAICSLAVAGGPQFDEGPKSFVALMLGMIYACTCVSGRRNLAGINGQVDRMFADYIPIFRTLQKDRRLRPEPGSPGMPRPPGPPPPPPGAPPSGSSGRQRSGGARGPQRGPYPSGSGTGSGVTGQGYPSSGRYGSGYSLQQMRQVLHYVLSWGPGRSPPHIAKLHRRLAARRNPTPIFDLEGTKSVSLVDLNVATNSKSAFLTRQPFSKHESSVVRVYHGKGFTILVRLGDLGANADPAHLAIIIPPLYTVSNSNSQSSAGLLEGDGNPLSRNTTSQTGSGSGNLLIKWELSSAINEMHTTGSPKDVVRLLRDARCFCVVDGVQATLGRLVF
ncbi:hypothetical protein B0H12DRAFT_1230172 [Mycena haematopus]|nr:hypothetical protein B0H12DRAFT_1230172 [Mycena haematopus]